MPPLTKPMNKGMDEQEQNGVMAPKRERGQQILQTIHTMGEQIVTQTLNGETGIDNTHEHADAKKQNQNLDGIVKEKVKGRAPRGAGPEAKHFIDQPIGKILYHTCQEN